MWELENMEEIIYSPPSNTGPNYQSLPEQAKEILQGGVHEVYIRDDRTPIMWYLMHLLAFVKDEDPIGKATKIIDDVHEAVEWAPLTDNQYEKMLLPIIRREYNIRSHRRLPPRHLSKVPQHDTPYYKAKVKFVTGSEQAIEKIEFVEWLVDMDKERLAITLSSEEGHYEEYTPTAILLDSNNEEYEAESEVSTRNMAIKLPLEEALEFNINMDEDEDAAAKRRAFNERQGLPDVLGGGRKSRRKRKTKRSRKTKKSRKTKRSRKRKKTRRRKHRRVSL